MKKKDLIKKLGAGALILTTASALCACSSSTANGYADTKTAGAAAPQYYESYDYQGDFYDYAPAVEEDYEYYGDEFGVNGVDAGLGDSLTETQINTSVAQNRKLIKTVNLTIETQGYDATMNSIREKINAVGGYIESENSYNGSIYNNSGNAKYATITVRVPESALDEFVTNVSGVGNVTQKTTSTEDVTLNYVDTQSKKEMYLAEQESLLALLEKAESIEDITYLTQRLTEVRYNIESMESTIRVYDDLVDYATVNLFVNEVKVLTPTVIEEKTPGQELKEGFATSVKDVLIGTRTFFIRLIINLPYIIRGLLCLAIPALIVFIIVKVIINSNKKKKAKAASNEAKTINENNVSSKEENKEEASKK